MSDAWRRPVEQILLATVNKKQRVLGFTSPQENLRVRALSLSVAEAFARSGMSTLLIGLAETVSEDETASTWTPGDAAVAGAIVRDNRGFDRLVAHPTSEARHRFNNVDGLRHWLVKDLRRYSRIVLDLPGVSSGPDARLNPAGPAAACDAIYVVCTTDRSSRSDVSEAVQTLRMAGAPLAGVVLDDAFHLSLGEDIARSILRRLAFAPKLAASLARRARASRLLN